MSNKDDNESPKRTEKPKRKGSVFGGLRRPKAGTSPVPVKKDAKDLPKKEQPKRRRGFTAALRQRASSAVTPSWIDSGSRGSRTVSNRERVVLNLQSYRGKYDGVSAAVSTEDSSIIDFKALFTEINKKAQMRIEDDDDVKKVPGKDSNITKLMTDILDEFSDDIVETMLKSPEVAREIGVTVQNVNPEQGKMLFDTCVKSFNEQLVNLEAWQAKNTDKNIPQVKAFIEFINGVGEGYRRDPEHSTVAPDTDQRLNMTADFVLGQDEVIRQIAREGEEKAGSREPSVLAEVDAIKMLAELSTNLKSTNQTTLKSCFVNPGKRYGTAIGIAKADIEKDQEALSQQRSAKSETPSMKP